MGGKRGGSTGPEVAAGPTVSRRRALALLGGTCGLAFLRPMPARPRSCARPASTHPDPRPGIDASAVLPPERVAPHARELYDHVREIPQIVDGIRCQCGCADLPGMYSLLSCYGESGHGAVLRDLLGRGPAGVGAPQEGPHP